MSGIHPKLSVSPVCEWKKIYDYQRVSSFRVLQMSETAGISICSDPLRLALFHAGTAVKHRESHILEHNENRSMQAYETRGQAVVYHSQMNSFPAP
ncbi:MAG TPA: hypothetical protein ENI89_08460 [Desulfobulbus sp.]|nr:hypothetical protein [Desulfobulbus sp.]